MNLGADANAVPDPLGDEYQWLSAGAGFASDKWWLPGGRIGVRKNVAGSQLTYLTAGVTFFNFINLDVASTTETIKLNGQTVPRGAMANLSFMVAF